MVALSIELNSNTISIQGELTRHTLTQVGNQKVKSLLIQQSSTVDLQQLTKVDTAGLAWLLYLFEQAQQVNCQLHFANLPAKLDNLIKLSGVDGFLPE